MNLRYPGTAISEHQLPRLRIGFQPIFNVLERRVLAYEAKVDGLDGEPLETILSQIDPRLLPSLHLKMSYDAIQAAAALGIRDRQASLYLPMADRVEAEPMGVEFLTRTAIEAGLEPSDLLLETASGKNAVGTTLHSMNLDAMEGFDIAVLHPLGMDTATVLKLPRTVVAHLDERAERRAFISDVLRLCEPRHLLVIAAGVQTRSECSALQQLGVYHMQGQVFGPTVAGSLAAEYTYSSAA